MLAVGRERARERGLDLAVTFEQGNAEELPYPDRSFDCVTIAFGIRNVPRIERALAEAYRVLKIGGRFLCLEFSTVDVPGLDALYELYSFNVIPRIGEAVTGDREAYQYLVESIRKFPAPRAFRRDDRSRRISPRLVHRHDRRRGGVAFGLALVISGISPSHPSRPRRFRVRARGRVRAGRYAAAAAAGQDRRRGRPADRTAERQRRHRAGSPPR